MKYRFRIRLWLIVAVIAALSMTPNAVHAHEQREMGEYKFVVGWIDEPSFEGLKNGVSVRVTKTGHTHEEEEVEEHTHEEEEAEVPVAGLQDTLQVEVTHVSSGRSRTVKLRTVFGDPGHYTADLIPTVPGVYSFRVFGTIEETEFEETFLSLGGGGGFDDVVSLEELQFPEELPSIREVVGAVRGAQNTAQQAQDAALEADDSASSANTLAIVGIALGAVGIVGSAVATFRRR